ncbi:5-bromo-4-chloroindolyl phosphate hydrolysis family protein [Peribacillus kribbensis]|uniref:5-bromo-4-chloroindolyl phosphate hydrolysis family protein n=1 Tax=Peribacillus kribbensis TaxID=356658 RepID=UPI00047925C6|nr:5-bromo-4-chloroindolyl phosphate hydrolysis family protein [Peribacillus kribbensis]
MNKFAVLFLSFTAAVPAAFTIFLFSFFGLSQSLWISFIFSLLGAFIFFWGVSRVVKSRFLKKQGLTRKEYRYIEQNLLEAKQKLFRLHKALMVSRHLPSLRKRIELIKITRRIFSLTKKEPKRFYQAHDFYFSHLDSVVELTEKYNLLASQPKKSLEIDMALFETLNTMDELIDLIDKDLFAILSEDLEQLQFELDVAKRSMETLPESN